MTKTQELGKHEIRNCKMVSFFFCFGTSKEPGGFSEATAS